MSTKESMPSPLPCPLCGATGRIMVTLGNHWVGCVFNKTCAGNAHLGISPHKRRAIKEWNRWAESQPKQEARP